MKNKQTFIDRILQNRVASHLFFWCFFLFTFIILAAVNTEPFKNQLFNYAALLPAQILAAYTLNYFQIPRLLLRKKYLLFGLSLLVFAYIFSVIGRFGIIYGAEPFFRTDYIQETPAEILSDVTYLFSVYFPTTYLYAFIMLCVRAIKDRFDEKHRIELLEKEKATNELKFLRAQIQPHFLFNTLNNLYALTLAKSDLAPQVVLKLSELLDFILYESGEPTIPIAKEIELIQGYIELESLRYGTDLKLTFHHETDDKNTPIAPLILLPLIENAFKHGSKGKSGEYMVHIKLAVVNNVLDFSVFNTKPIVLIAEKSSDKSGIGTSNLNRQLELNYPDSHALDVTESQEDYLVSLRINLNRKEA